MGGASEPLVVEHMPPSIDAITPVTTYGDTNVVASTDAAYRWLGTVYQKLLVVRRQWRRRFAIASYLPVVPSMG
eukprot:4936545-Pyramimonas_sp.AAC.1